LTELLHPAAIGNLMILRSAYASACCLALAPLLAVASTSAAPPTPSAAPHDAADDWFDKGLAAYEAHHKEEAEHDFAEAWKLKKTQDIAANLGTVEQEQREFRKAAGHLAYAVAHAAPTDTDAARKNARDRLAQVRTHVGAVRVRVNVAGATVYANGVIVGQAPLEAEVFVDPGACTIEAKLAGYADARSAVTATAGASQEATLTLAPLNGRPPDGGGPTTAVLVGGGVAAGAALVVGAVFTGLAVSKASQANQLGGWDVCYGATAPAPNHCPQLDGLRHDSATFGNVAFWSFVGGATVGAATIAYGVLAPRAKETKTGLLLVPVAAARGAGLSLSGEW
jgi:hypothetical protein